MSAYEDLGVATHSGSGESTVFHLTGSGFIAGAEVTIRGARVGADGVFNVYWTTQALPQGAIAIDLPVPCLSGISISFSANDGRRDPHDLTDRFWSNTVTPSCP